MNTSFDDDVVAVTIPRLIYSLTLSLSQRSSRTGPITIAIKFSFLADFGPASW